jgi:peroxiredoxin
MRKLISVAILLVLSPLARAESVTGRWDATVTIKEAEIPFRIDFAGDGTQFTGTVFNGDLPVSSTGGRFENGKLEVNFGHYLSKLDATVKDGQIEGKLSGRFERDRYISSYPFRARRYTPVAATNETVPAIGGIWEIPHDSPKGEKSWHFIVRQKGPEVAAAILRVDGDTGTLTGTYKDGKFVVSHFSGSRPLLLEIKPGHDNTLEIIPSGAYTVQEKLVAYRPADARAKGLPEPTDPDKHTRVKNPAEVFKFSFPDVDGNIVSNTDSRFAGNVVVAVVTGTWCPNCHDEAQLLVELDRKYRDRGLRVVALDFEEPEQQEDGLKRARSFIKKYGVEYPYLIAGAPIEMWEKVPQAENLNSWPTTFFVGRDGRVKLIHAGFAAPASGEFHAKVREEFVSTIERLLAEKTTAAR